MTTERITLEACPNVTLALRRPIVDDECDRAGTGGFVIALAALVKSLEKRIDELEKAEDVTEADNLRASIHDEGKAAFEGVPRERLAEMLNVLAEDEDPSYQFRLVIEHAARKLREPERRRIGQILAILKTCDWAAWDRVIEGLETKGRNTERDINATIGKMRRLREVYERYAAEEA